MLVRPLVGVENIKTHTTRRSARGLVCRLFQERPFSFQKQRQRLAISTLTVFRGLPALTDLIGVCVGVALLFRLGAAYPGTVQPAHLTSPAKFPHHPPLSRRRCGLSFHSVKQYDESDRPRMLGNLVEYGGELKLQHFPSCQCYIRPLSIHRRG